VPQEAGSNQSDDPPDSPRRRSAAGTSKSGPEHSPERRADPAASLTQATNGATAPAAVAERPPEPPSVPPAAIRNRRGPYVGRDLTTGSVPRNLFTLAWPQVVEGLLNVVDQVWDLFLAGQGFGFRAIAGIGSAQQVVQLARTGRMGLDTAMRAMIARAVGAGDRALARHIAQQAFTVNALLALLVTGLGVLFTEAMLRALGISDAVIAEAASYMRWQFAGTLALTARMATGAALQASGDAVTPMKATTAARLIDLALAPILMFGWLGAPAFGVAGVAVANLIGQSLGAGINVRNLATGRSGLHVTLAGYHFDPKLIWRLVRIGAPATINSIERSAAQVILLGLMAPFGDVALAAYALTQRTQAVVNIGTQGLGNAAGIIAGQSLGAGSLSRARATVLWALGYVSAAKMVVVGLLFAFPEFFLSIFNDDPELLDVGSNWLRIMLLGYFAMGPVQVLMQSFQTAGDTVMPMVSTLLAMWLIEVPLAIVLSGASENLHPFGWTLPFPSIGGFGQYGVAIAITVAAFFRLAMYLPYFVWGPWHKKRVLEGVRAAEVVPEDILPPVSPGR
jgi:putative MATE family efflux protein